MKRTELDSLGADNVLKNIHRSMNVNMPDPFCYILGVFYAETLFILTPEENVSRLFFHSVTFRVNEENVFNEEKLFKLQVANCYVSLRFEIWM